MSALPIPTSFLAEPTKMPPAPKGVGFIPLREACYRSGIPMETLARRCRGEWANDRMAALLKPADGGKTCWHVREDADPLLARVKSPAAMRIDWGQYSERQRETMRRRKLILDEWLEARADGFASELSERSATETFVAERRGTAQRVSRGTLYRWLSAYTAAGLAGLVDSRQQVVEPDADVQWFTDELRRLYLSSRRRSAALCYDRAADRAMEENRPVPFSKRQAQRILKAIDPKVAAYHRCGSREYNARHGKHIIRSRDVDANALWVSDGHRFDVFVAYQGKQLRPILVSWMDEASRLIVGYTIVPRSENADAIRLAFRRGVARCGLPLAVYHDNGDSYLAKQLANVTRSQRRRGALPVVDVGVFSRMGVEVRRALPFNAKAKSLERLHRTINQRFSCEQPGWCGGDTASKPFDLEKQKGDGKLLDFDEFVQRFDDWLTADYHHRAHEGLDGKTPAEVYAERLRDKRVIDPGLIDLELSRRERIKVGRNGVKLGPFTYEAPELDSLMGREVTVLVNDDQTDRVLVLNNDGSCLCEAQAREPVPVNATGEQLREALASIKRDAKRVREYQDVRMRIADDPAERMHRLAREREQSSPLPAADVLKPVQPTIEVDSNRPGPKPSRPFRYADLLDEAVGQ